MLRVLALLLALPAAAAPRAEQRLVYDLSVDGQKAGTREVAIAFLPPDDLLPVETRIIESYEEITARVKGLDVRVRTRVTARVSDGSTGFVASHDLNGTVQEVQGRSGSDGRWMVTVVEKGRTSASVFRRSEVDLTTMDLLDPERGALADGATTRVLVAEAGQVYAGPVRDLGEATLRVGGRDVPVHRWEWAPPEGRVVVSRSLDGLLLGYEAAFLGTSLVARAREVPEARTFGEIDLQPLISSDGKVFEEEL